MSSFSFFEARFLIFVDDAGKIQTRSELFFKISSSGTLRFSIPEVMNDSVLSLNKFSNPFLFLANKIRLVYPLATLTSKSTPQIGLIPFFMA